MANLYIREHELSFTIYVLLNSCTYNKHTNLLCEFLSLLGGDGLLLHVVQFGNSLGVITKVNLKEIRNTSSQLNPHQYHRYNLDININAP